MCQSETKKILRRLTKDNIKVMGRQIGREISWKFLIYKEKSHIIIHLLCLIWC